MDTTITDLSLLKPLPAECPVSGVEATLSKVFKQFHDEAGQYPETYTRGFELRDDQGNTFEGVVKRSEPILSDDHVGQRVRILSDIGDDGRAFGLKIKQVKRGDKTYLKLWATNKAVFHFFGASNGGAPVAAPAATPPPAAPAPARPPRTSPAPAQRASAPSPSVDTVDLRVHFWLKALETVHKGFKSGAYDLPELSPAEQAAAATHIMIGWNQSYNKPVFRDKAGATRAPASAAAPKFAAPAPSSWRSFKLYDGSDTTLGDLTDAKSESYDIAEFMRSVRWALVTSGEAENRVRRSNILAAAAELDVADPGYVAENYLEDVAERPEELAQYLKAKFGVDAVSDLTPAQIDWIIRAPALQLVEDISSVTTGGDGDEIPY